MSADPAPVVVYVAPSPMVGEVIRARLESCGIQAALQYESLGRVLGLFIDGWGETRVIVPAERAEEARAILAGDECADLPAEGEELT